MDVDVSKKSVNGLDVFGLSNRHLSLEMIPALGAKITSLRDFTTGRQWLWTKVGEEGFTPRRSEHGYEEANLGGIDECIPTIAACRWRDSDLPDHGEAWSQPWTIDERALSDQRLTAHLRLPVYPLRFERSITLHEREVQLDYSLKNLASDAREYMWSWHPIFDIEEGDRIELPPDCSQFRIYVALGNDLGPMGAVRPWPEPEPGVRLDHLNFGHYGPGAIKLFTDPLSRGYAAIRNERTGAGLAIHFDVRANNTLGIWLARGERGYHHLALEPTNGAPDGLDAAVTDWKRFASLQPGETHSWSLRMVLSGPKP